MSACVRIGCGRPALAGWWRLCACCTSPLMTGVADIEKTAAAGWDALAWAERIAPAAWGNASDDDPWVTAARCLTFASVVTGRATGCPHTSTASAALPVVHIARAPHVLMCPPCAEPTVAAVSVGGPSCDRCRSVAPQGVVRTAAVAGSSLVVVAELCSRCRHEVLPLSVAFEQR